MTVKKRHPKIATATTLKAPVGQTRAFVNYYLNLGVDRVYLFFDDPEDPAIGLFGDNPRVTEIRCDDEYWSLSVPEGIDGFNRKYLVQRQRVNATRALHWAREAGIDWISHVDVDELVYPAGKLDLKKYLGSSPFKIIRFTILEAVPERLEYENVFAEIGSFKKPAVNAFPTLLRYPWNSLMLWMAKRSGVRTPFEINDRFFRAHTKSKVIVRTDLDIDDMKLHGPKCRSRHLTYRAKRIYLLHFDSCGFRFWLDRWKFKLSGAAKPKKKKRQKITLHMERLMEGRASREELISSYENLHYLNQEDLLKLRKFGLIKEISLPPDSFK